MIAVFCYYKQIKIGVSESYIADLISVCRIGPCFCTESFRQIGVQIKRKMRSRTDSQCRSAESVSCICIRNDYVEFILQKSHIRGCRSNKSKITARPYPFRVKRRIVGNVPSKQTFARIVCNLQTSSFGSGVPAAETVSYTTRDFSRGNADFKFLSVFNGKNPVGFSCESASVKIKGKFIRKGYPTGVNVNGVCNIPVCQRYAVVSCIFYSAAVCSAVPTVKNITRPCRHNQSIFGIILNISGKLGNIFGSSLIIVANVITVDHPACVKSCFGRNPRGFECPFESKFFVAVPFVESVTCSGRCDGNAYLRSFGIRLGGNCRASVSVENNRKRSIFGIIRSVIAVFSIVICWRLTRSQHKSRERNNNDK